jgi:hypothetical protein
MAAHIMEDAAVGYNESLAIFDKPLQDIGIKRVKYLDYFPVNDYTTQGVIQFQIPGIGNDYMDLSRSYLKIECKIINKDGTPLEMWQEPTTPAIVGGSRVRRQAIAETAKESTSENRENNQEEQPPADDGDESAETLVDITESPAATPSISAAPVNNTMHSIFSRVDVTLQNKVVTESDTHYAYLAYMKALLNTTNAQKEGPMQMQLFYKVDKAPLQLKWMITEDQSLHERGAFFNASNTVELAGGLYCDIFEINKLIPNGVGLGITLYPSNPEFAIMSDDSGVALKMVITKATFKLCSMEVSPEIAAAHAEVLKDHPAIYTYTKTELKRFTLPKGIFSTDINDPFAGRVPSELVIGLVKGRASHGVYEEDPFAFGHFHVSRVQVTVDGIDMGEGPIETKYTEDRVEFSNYLDAYRSLRGCNGVEDECPFSRTAYLNGKNAFYRFVSSPETLRNAGSEVDVTPLRRLGNVRVSLRFDKELPEAMTVVMFGKFPGGLKIDKNRSVTEL